ncbi:MAG TPA: metalloregulator ArsR/SmtB family transcription factor [Nitrososphaeraceae archaeon]|jgi:DNA-binding transcriptional ArsR family regulator
MGSQWKALSDDNRRGILLLLKNRVMTPTRISEHFNFTLPALSCHLHILKDANLITQKKEGKNRFYSIDSKGALEMMEFLKTCITSS